MINFENGKNNLQHIASHYTLILITQSRKLDMNMLRKVYASTPKRLRVVLAEILEIVLSVAACALYVYVQ
jgi:hypothetical protein